jgi:ketosteroid isomerase-like protein
MKGMRLVGLVFISFQIIVGQNSAPATSEEKALVQVENDWGDAVSRGDPSKLERVIADDWIGRYPFYVLTKAQELELIKSGDIKVRAVTTSDLKVRLFRDVAIVTGTDDAQGSYYKGRDVSGRYLWMDIFVKRNGRWQAVASEETLVMSK